MKVLAASAIAIAVVLLPASAGGETIDEGEVAAAAIHQADRDGLKARQWLEMVRGIDAAWALYLGAGGLVCPVPGSTFVDSWGAARAGHTHVGVDMMAPDGTPILAPATGVYEQHGSESFYLHADNGTTYFGTHLQEHVAPSGRVEAGDVVALVGHSGNASPGAPHLHFEIHPGGGGPVSPYPATAAACL